jgi:hypothetical protein
MTWGTEVEIERRKRIMLSLWAYAYEVLHISLVPDAVFDKLAEEINPEITTDNPLLDEFFKTEFVPFSGIWIHKHPELDKLYNMYRRLYA